MTNTIAGERRVDHEFYRLGMGYFVTARASAMSMIATVTGNQYHHALEMLIKGHLTHTMSFEQLKKDIGHDLRKAWQRLKECFPNADLSVFDPEVEHLDRFEDIRYPGSSGRSGAVIVSWNVPILEHLSPEHQPYYLCVSRLDDLFDRLFVLCDINPSSCFPCMSPYTLQILDYDNRHFTRWFPQSWFDEEASKRVISIVSGSLPTAE